jgi:hypothetical protein
MLRAWVLAASATLPFVWNHPPAAPLRVPGGVAGIAMEGKTLVVAGRSKLLVAPLDTGRNYTRSGCVTGFARDGRSAVVLGGGVLAWICRGAPGPERVQLMSAKLEPRDAPAHIVDEAPGSSHPATIATPWLTNLVAGGGNIAYAHGDPLSHPIQLLDVPLRIPGADASWPLAIGDGAYVLTDGIHLVLRTATATAVVPTSGPPLAAAIDGGVLAVLVKDAIELHDLRTGAVSTIQIGGVQLMAASPGALIVATRRDVFAVDDHAAVAWLVASSSAPITAVAISRYGLAYAAQRQARTKIGFVSAVSMRTVFAARRRIIGPPAPASPRLRR